MKKGFIAISTVLVVSAVVLLTALTVTNLSIGEARSGLSLFKGEDNLAFVEGCMEDALLKIRSNSGYAGGSITRPEGTCSITASHTGANWTVTATNSTNTQYKRTIQVTATRTTSLTVTSWKEI